MQFKIGDKVKIKNTYGYFLTEANKNTEFNPTSVIGEVTKITKNHISVNQFDEEIFTVKWPNGHDNAYVGIQLDLVETVQTEQVKYIKLTLPADSEARKSVPLFSGCIKYFPAALAGVAALSKKGNDKHNAGQELHHARGKSMDHADCVVRHLADVADLLAKLERNEEVDVKTILEEVSSLAWRALAYSQELHEKYDGAPLAPGAKIIK